MSPEFPWLSTDQVGAAARRTAKDAHRRFSCRLVHIGVKRLVKTPQMPEVLLLDIGQNDGEPGRVSIEIPRRRQLFMIVVKRLQGDADLVQVVCATGAARRLTGRLYGRQEERDEHADDGDHHE